MPKKNTTQPPRAVKQLSRATYVGRVESKKTIYYVLHAGDDYLVYSFRDASHRNGNFNYVSAGNTDRVFKAFAGEQRVTCAMMLSRPRINRFFDRFTLLQTLYALVAEKSVKIDQRSPRSSTLFFNFASERKQKIAA